MTNTATTNGSSAKADGFRMTKLGPEELEKFAALFVPTWELPDEIASGADPGFAPAKVDAALVAQLAGEADAKPADAKAGAMPADAKPADAKPADAKPADAKPADAKPADAKTDEAEIAVDVEPVGAAPPAPRAEAPALPSIIVAPAAPAAPAAHAVAKADVASRLEADATDLDPVVPRKKSPALFVAIGAVALIGGAIALFSTGGSDGAVKGEAKPQVTEKKTIDLPEPTAAIETAAVKPAAEPAKAPEAPSEPAKAPEATPEPTAAKAPEPPKTAAPAPPPPPAAVKAPPPPPAVKAAPPPPPPKAAPPPPPTAKAPPPAPKAAAPAPKIKDKF